MYHNKPQTDAYLTSSPCVDWQSPSVKQKAKQLSAGCQSRTDIAKACFEYVRDKIKHSADYQLDGTTCTASEVLAAGHGFCYAKSHLLAALLRANGIPTALCYQRLTVNDNPQDGNVPTFCLHGLNAIYLPNLMSIAAVKSSPFARMGWYRVDARGNKTLSDFKVDAQFDPPAERLAFALKTKGECDISGIDGGLFAEPLPQVVAALKTHGGYVALLNNLPDMVCC